jgi:hypothetical protein
MLKKLGLAFLLAALIGIAWSFRHTREQVDQLKYQLGNQNINQFHQLGMDNRSLLQYLSALTLTTDPDARRSLARDSLLTCNRLGHYVHLTSLYDWIGRGTEKVESGCDTPAD